jgi:hypothetical protein
MDELPASSVTVAQPLIEIACSGRVRNDATDTYLMTPHLESSAECASPYIRHASVKARTSGMLL